MLIGQNCTRPFSMDHRVICAETALAPLPVVTTGARNANAHRPSSRGSHSEISGKYVTSISTNSMTP